VTHILRSDRITLTLLMIGAIMFPTALSYTFLQAGRDARAREAQAEQSRLELCDAINQARFVQRQVLLARQRIPPPLPLRFYEEVLPLTDPINCAQVKRGE
jgi:hypothetical protein